MQQNLLQGITQYLMTLCAKPFVLTAMVMDVGKQLRRLALLQAAGKQVDFTPSIDLARKLRNELYDRFLIVRILERDSRTLCENVKTWQKEYEALEQQNAENPKIAERIASQLRQQIPV
ncbi:hypothetical protein OSTOST_16790 [Ostertagia ostertagi]